MTKKVYRVHNWKHYNKSLVQRGSLTFWFSEEIMNEWKGKPGAHGNQKYSDAVILFGLTMRQLFRLPLRATKGLMESLIELNGLKVESPDYTTLCRRGKELNLEIEVRNKEEGRHVLIDSTGIQVIGEGEWKALKYGSSRCQVWKKLHITMDAEDQMILSGMMTESVRLDGNYLSPLVDKIKGSIKQITGDGAYDKTSCYEKAYQRKAKAVFPPQHNAAVQKTKNKKDPALNFRDEVILEIGRGEDRKEKLKKWKKENNYHRRSLIETMMFRMKTIFGDEMRSKTFENQQTDLLVRCYAMNRITQIGRAHV